MQLLSSAAGDAGGSGRDFDPDALYGADARPAPDGRPWVLVNMITSIDGATAVDGRSGGLGGPTDKAVFGALRGLADVIVVAAGTARTEGYGPVRISDDRSAARTARGQAPRARLVIVTRTLELDVAAPVFTESDPPVIVCTIEQADPQRRAAVEAVTEVVTMGDTDVDVAGLLRWLHAAVGARVVLVEGGPTLNAAFVAADVLDEVAWTIAPMLAGGTSARMVVGASPPMPVGLVCTRVAEQDGYLFVRYARP